MTAAPDPPPAEADAHWESVLAWWAAAGVSSAEAEAILAAPNPARSSAPARAGPQDVNAAKPQPVRPAPVAKLAAKPDAAALGVEAARALAAGAKDLAGLEKAIAGFDGCALKKEARTTVVFDGARTADILVIGEAPGKEEDAAGKPFVGPAGQLLDRMFAEIGLSRQSNMLITNVIYWRPPGNRAPDPMELALCRPFLDRTIQLVAPKAVLLIGGVAGQAMLASKDGVMRLRGQKLTFPSNGLTKPVNAMVMLHPAYLLRRPQDKRLAWADLRSAEAWLHGLGAGAVPSKA
jgi:uracil-DNA glycosylase